jgi:hypothetical protein
MFYRLLSRQRNTKKNKLILGPPLLGRFGKTKKIKALVKNSQIVEKLLNR